MLAISFIIRNWGDGSTYILSLFCEGASRGNNSYYDKGYMNYGID